MNIVELIAGEDEQSASPCRRSILISHAGKTLTLPEWSSVSGVNYRTLFDRIVKLKIVPERAFDPTPLHRKST